MASFTFAFFLVYTYSFSVSNVNLNFSAPSDALACHPLQVKVCDICGDAGREDLLAICSRCSDGAEHT